jgi:hypothetical protein
MGRTSSMSREPDPATTEPNAEPRDAPDPHDPDEAGEESFPASDPPAHWSGPDAEGA